MSMLAKLLGRDGAGLEVEPLRKKHLPDIMPIEQASYPRPWTPGVFQSELELARRGERHYLVARDGNEVVGYGGVMFVVDDAHVTNIAVAGERRRQGVATRLLAELAWEAIARGCHALTLEVRISNVGARYYENIEDAIIMWCNDIQGDEYRVLLDTIRSGSQRRNTP